MILKVLSLSSTCFYFAAMSNLSFHFHVDSCMPKFEYSNCFANQTGDQFVIYISQFLIDVIISIISKFLIFLLAVDICVFSLVFAHYHMLYISRIHVNFLILRTYKSLTSVCLLFPSKLIFMVYFVFQLIK